jgi:hypothetical protein
MKPSIRASRYDSFALWVASCKNYTGTAATVGQTLCLPSTKTSKISWPGLERLSIRETKLGSMTSLASMYLRELKLVHVVVPMPALSAFFQLLEGKATPIAQTLQRFTHYCPQHPLSIEAVDAAIHVLERNHRLYSVTLLLESEIFDVNNERFEAFRDVNVVLDKLPYAASKLAVLSVVEHYAKRQPSHPIGRLDSGCVAGVFRWFVRTGKRRIQVLKDYE